MAEYAPFVITTMPDGREIGRLASGADIDVTALAANMAHRAHRAAYPRKSMAATLRQRRLKLTMDERHALMVIAQRQLKALTAPADWLSVSAVARELGRPVHELEGMLRTEAGRRELGWPWYIGGVWRIPAVAIRADTRAVYMATLPEGEPFGPPAL